MTETEFLEEIERINQDLARKGVPVHARGFAAFQVMAKGYGGPVFGAGIDPRAYPPFVGPNLFERIGDWYTERYATRMNLPSDRGRVPVMIRGDLYLVRIPLTFGNPRVSILPLVQGMTESLAGSLSPAESGAIKGAFLDGFALVYEVEDLRMALDQAEMALGEPASLMVTNAIRDRDRAASCLEGNLPDTNGACFNVQQHAEKMLKSFLLAKGILTPTQLKRSYGHDLPRLLRECCLAAGTFAEVASDVERLARVTMDIRYARPMTGVIEAHDMMWAGLRVGGLSACSVSGRARRYARAPNPGALQ